MPTMEAVSEQKFVKPLPTFTFRLIVASVPSELLGKVTMRPLVGNRLYFQSVQPWNRDVLPWKTERWLSNQEAFEAVNAL